MAADPSAVSTSKRHASDVRMSLTGTYHRTLDEKQRLAVPKRLRSDLCDSQNPVLYVAPETEQALALYSTREFQRRAESVVHTLPQHTTLRNYHRLYYSQAEQVELDSQGRIRLPDRLVAFAGLDQEIVMLGVHDRVEIWDRGRWQQFLEAHASGFDNLAHAAFGVVEVPLMDDLERSQTELPRVPR